MAQSGSTTPSETMTASMQATTDGMQDQMARVMRGNAEVGQRWLEGCGRLMSELVSFSGTRMQQDLRTLQQATACKDAGEAMQLQMTGLQDMMRAYMDEAGKLYTMWTEVGDSCARAFEAAPKSANEAGSKPRSSKSSAAAAE